MSLPLPSIITPTIPTPSLPSPTFSRFTEPSPVFIQTPYGYEAYGNPYGYVYNGFWSWISIFWVFFIIFIMVLVLVLIAVSSSSTLTNGMAFPTTQNIQLTNQSGQLLTTVYFMDSNQTISVLSTPNGISVPIGGSFVVPLQSGSMVWAQDNYNKTYATVFCNVNGKLQMVPFTTSSTLSFFTVYSTSLLSNSYSSYSLNNISVVPNPITLPNTIALVNNMTFPTSINLMNESTSKKYYSVISSNQPIRNLILNSGSSPTPTPSGQSPYSIGQVAPGGYVLYLSIIPGASNIYSGTILFNVDGKVFIQTLFGQPSTDYISVPSGYTHPLLHMFGIHE